MRSRRSSRLSQKSAQRQSIQELDSQRIDTVSSMRQPEIQQGVQKEKGSRRSSRNSRKTLGAEEEGEFVHKSSQSSNNINTVQTFGKEVGQGGSASLHSLKEKSSRSSKAEVSDEFVIKQNQPLQGSNGFEEIRNDFDMLDSSHSQDKKVVHQKFIKAEEDISDFDFEVNKAKAKGLYFDNEGMRESVGGEEDSIIKAFEQAKIESAPRFITSPSRTQDLYSRKTEVVSKNNKVGPKKIHR